MRRVAQQGKTGRPGHSHGHSPNILIREMDSMETSKAGSPPYGSHIPVSPRNAVAIPKDPVFALEL